LKDPVGIREIKLCQHPGCQKEGVPCYSASGEESSRFYCFDHRQEHGFCNSLLSEASEFFDFGSSLSGNCLEDLEAGFWGDEEDFDRRTPDERNDHEEILEYYRGKIPKEVSHCDPFPEKIGLRNHYLRRKWVRIKCLFGHKGCK